MEENKKIITWLSWCYIMLICMIVIGGITRLTESGLSITEWNPIKGAIPPLDSYEWGVEFEKYKNTPEYKKINFDITLSEFKRIYFIEYIHRLFGRIIGIVFIVPFIYFTVRGYIHKGLAKFLGFVFLLGTIQAGVGWYMVKSGLKDVPNVSHFRLAFHLLFALLIVGLILWKIFSLKKSRTLMLYKKNLWLNALLVIIQIAYGAFVAGLDAGKIYNTFPLMGDRFIPDEVLSSSFDMFFSNPATVQFVHRVVAYLIIINYGYIVIKSILDNKKHFLVVIFPLGLLLSVQVILGVLTILLEVPLLIAVLHQLIAVALFSISLYYIYLCSSNYTYIKR